MKNNVKISIGFALGVAIGVIATRLFFKQKYKAIAKEEIDSVKEVYSKKNKHEETYESSETEITNYEDIIDEMAYTAKNDEKGGSESMKKEKMIEVIPPDEFGEDDDYDLISITYYADGVLADDGNYPIDDVEDTVGPDALDSFGEWEDDAVYVRNDKRKCYYEILRDVENYSDLQVDGE